MTHLDWAVRWTSPAGYSTTRFTTSWQAALDLAHQMVREGGGRARVTTAHHWLHGVVPPRGDFGGRDLAFAADRARQVRAAHARQDFLDAITEPDHPVWDRLIDGIVRVWRRHPA